MKNEIKIQIEYQSLINKQKQSLINRFTNIIRFSQQKVNIQNRDNQDISLNLKDIVRIFLIYLLQQEDPLIMISNTRYYQNHLNKKPKLKSSYILSQNQHSSPSPYYSENPQILF
ncbi:unnamed protein product [Paramecium sonneborni]|uniref:Uncharacterized protein n=1 Tax=Paramecium sonneborni TaxID=65129 RepID=A0A8S1L7I8_9CILI|nr:unnamed protein product [Paramecium sonneborni]